MTVSQNELDRWLAQNDQLAIEGADAPESPRTRPTRKAKKAPQIKTPDRRYALFEEVLGQYFPPYEQEYSFHPARRWRLDYYWPQHAIALEIEGGRYLKTSSGYSKGHAHPVRFANDIDKYNAVAIAGILLIRSLPDRLFSHALPDLIQAFATRGRGIVLPEALEMGKD